MDIRREESVANNEVGRQHATSDVMQEELAGNIGKDGEESDETAEEDEGACSHLEREFASEAPIVATQCTRINERTKMPCKSAPKKDDPRFAGILKRMFVLLSNVLISPAVRNHCLAVYTLVNTYVTCTHCLWRDAVESAAYSIGRRLASGRSIRRWT
jgi:hypothetical protein